MLLHSGTEPIHFCVSRKCRWLPSSQSYWAFGLLSYTANTCGSLFVITLRSLVLLISSFSSHIKYFCFLIYFPTVHSLASHQGYFLPQLADLVPSAHNDSVLPGFLRSPMSALSESHEALFMAGSLAKGPQQISTSSDSTLQCPAQSSPSHSPLFGLVLQEREAMESANNPHLSPSWSNF